MSIVSNINTTMPTNSSNSNSPTLVNVGGNSLTQADFLKIMIAQFTQQDPLASGDGSGGSSGTSDYLNPLLSMTNLTTLQTMSGQQATQLVETLPGATVNISYNGVNSTGVVQSARVDKATEGVYFTVGGTEYPSSALYSVAQTAAQNAAAANTPASSTP